MDYETMWKSLWDWVGLEGGFAAFAGDEPTALIYVGVRKRMADIEAYYKETQDEHC